MDNVTNRVVQSWERFMRLAWPLLQSSQIPRWCGETQPWQTATRGTTEDDYASIDGWFDGTVPFQERIQVNENGRQYDFHTITLRNTEVTRLREWATSPFGKEPSHPQIWVHGYGDPLFRLYVAPTCAVLIALDRQQPDWQTNTQDGTPFIALQAAGFDNGMCAKWEPQQDGWKIR